MLAVCSVASGRRAEKRHCHYGEGCCRRDLGESCRISCGTRGGLCVAERYMFCGC